MSRSNPKLEYLLSGGKNPKSSSPICGGILSLLKRKLKSWTKTVSNYLQIPYGVSFLVVAILNLRLPRLPPSSLWKTSSPCEAGGQTNPCVCDRLQSSFQRRTIKAGGDYLASVFLRPLSARL
jgi:hypothetical protein